MRTCSVLTTVGICAALAAAPVRAHHAFSAEFDSDKPVTLVGTVTKLEWINPHAWIHMDVAGPDGKIEAWMVEMGSPNVLLRRGFNKTMVQTGTTLRVRGYAAKSGARKANGGDVTLPDGQTLLVGSLGTGAPDEKR